MVVVSTTAAILTGLAALLTALGGFKLITGLLIAGLVIYLLLSGWIWIAGILVVAWVLFGMPKGGR